MITVYYTGITEDQKYSENTNKARVMTSRQGSLNPSNHAALFFN